jgi:hypothetical protein
MPCSEDQAAVRTKRNKSQYRAIRWIGRDDRSLADTFSEGEGEFEECIEGIKGE